MKISIIEDFDTTLWQELVDNSSTATFFQTPQCFHFYKSLSFLETFSYGVTECSNLKGVILGYIIKDGGPIKQFFSKRAIITGGPLLADDISDNALSLLLYHLTKSLTNKAIYIETRNFNDYSKYKSVFQECEFKYNPHLNFQIDCLSEEIVLRNLGKSRKRDIKTSLRDGASYVNAPAIEQVQEFYKILKDLYLTKVKTPLFPFEFFQALYSSSFAKFLLVELNGKIIGGTVIVLLENRSAYEWFACGLDGQYKNIYPSTLATYFGIKYAYENGVASFDMMGAGKQGEDYGVRDFKAKFGGELVEHGRFICVTKPMMYQIGKLGLKILKRIK